MVGVSIKPDRLQTQQYSGGRGRWVAGISWLIIMIFEKVPSSSFSKKKKKRMRKTRGFSPWTEKERKKNKVRERRRSINLSLFYTYYLSSLLWPFCSVGDRRSLPACFFLIIIWVVILSSPSPTFLGVFFGGRFLEGTRVVSYWALLASLFSFSPALARCI